MDALLKLRHLCANSGIYTLSWLAVLEQIKPNLTQTDLAGRVKISKSTIGQALIILELNGLIIRTDVRHRCTFVRTADGDFLLSQARALFGT